MDETIPVLAVIILTITSTLLVLNINWRTGIIALGIQYLAAFYLFTLIFPLSFAAIKLVVGWMSVSILGSITPPEEQIQITSINRAGWLFRLMASAMAIVLAFSMGPNVILFVPTGLVIVWGGLILVIMGVLHLGMTTQPANVIQGLLTVICGFDILYTSVESSTLVVGLLAVTTLGLALSGSYLITSEQEEEVG